MRAIIKPLFEKARVKDTEPKPLSVDDLHKAASELRTRDAEGFRRLLDKLLHDSSLGLSMEILPLARTLEYTDAEVLEAVDSMGLPRVFEFLRREVKRRQAAKTSSPQRIQ